VVAVCDVNCKNKYMYINIYVNNLVVPCMLKLMPVAVARLSYDKAFVFALALY